MPASLASCQKVSRALLIFAVAPRSDRHHSDPNPASAPRHRLESSLLILDLFVHSVQLLCNPGTPWKCTWPKYDDASASMNWLSLGIEISSYGVRG